MKLKKILDQSAKKSRQGNEDALTDFHRNTSQKNAASLRERKDNISHDTFHLKPKELSKNALIEANDELIQSNHIFSKLSFSNFNLDLKLVDIIQRSTDDGGLGLFI
jgi:hypothetical protein